MTGTSAIDRAASYIKAGMASTLTGIYYTNGADFTKGSSKTVELLEGNDPTSAFSVAAHAGIMLACSTMLF